MTNESSDYNSYSYYRIKIKNWLIKYKYLILVFIFYLILNSLFLTKLPIFNDEAIYLDWGWTAAHWPGYLYQSMADGKQPLIMWLFGIASNFASDPLLSGRFASVLLGGFSLIGLYLTAKTLFNEKVGLFASLIFAVTPIFVFYNRQALFEAGLIFSIIWSFYYFLKFIQKPDYKNASLLGIFFGIGLFIKTTILIFAFPMTLILLWQIVIKKRSELTTPAIISIGAFLAVDALILINPVFWEALSSNSRYSYTFSDLLRFPIISWMNNLIGFFEIGLFFITPLVFIISLIGIFLIAKLKELDKAIFIFVFCISLLMEIILTRSQSQRYLVSFLPFLTICSAYVLDKLWNLKKYDLVSKIIVVFIVLTPLISSLFLIVNPYQYITQLSDYTSYSETGYIYGQTSGYGINELVTYVKEETGAGYGYVFFALTAGNPENAIDVYSQMTNNLLTFRMDSALFPGIEQYNCISSSNPTFYVARNDQRSGMDQFLELKKSIKTKSDNYSINVYGLKKCEDEGIAIESLYGPSINELIRRKKM